MKYAVLQVNNDESLESTYFENHERALKYCEKQITHVKTVYKIISRNPMVLGALNVYGSKPFETFCPVRQMEFRFSNEQNIKFVVV